MKTVDRIIITAKEKGISLSFLCRQLGLLSRTYFTDIKKNNREIPDDKLSIIADSLGVSTAYLKGETDKEKPTAEGDRLLKEALDIMKSLSPEDQAQAMKYLAFLADSSKKQ